jgi:hypothetical protein
MPRQILIGFDVGADIHRVRNFNDALYSLARKDDSMSFAIDQLDKATGQLVNIKSASRVRRACARIEKLIVDHGFAGIARISVIKRPT